MIEHLAKTRINSTERQNIELTRQTLVWVLITHIHSSPLLPLGCASSKMVQKVHIAGPRPVGKVLFLAVRLFEMLPPIWICDLLGVSSLASCSTTFENKFSSSKLPNINFFQMKELCR